MTMVKAINYITVQLKSRMNLIFKYVDLIKDSEVLFKQYELTLATIMGSTLNPSVQQTALSTTILRISATKQMIEDLVKKGQAKLANFLEIYLKLLD